MSQVVPPQGGQQPQAGPGPWHPQPFRGRKPGSARPRWLVPAVVVALVGLVCGCVVAAQVALFVATPFGPAAAPADPCALIPQDVLEAAVPAPTIKRSEGDNSSRTTTRAQCEVETDPDQAASADRARLGMSISRHGTGGTGGPEATARRHFAEAKQRTASQAGRRVEAVPGLGDGAYVVYEDGLSEPEERRFTVTLVALRGADTIAAQYGAGPTSEELAVASASTIVRSVINRL